MSTERLEDQIYRFAQAVESFAACIDALGEKSFLVKLNGWSARDILAHLIGWNRHVIEGSKQIQRGELPFYDIDPGENYSNVNAALVRQYDSNSGQVLLDQLETTARELKEYLRGLDAATWARDFGVRHDGSRVTISETVDELIKDYDHHRRQIEDWARSR